VFALMAAAAKPTLGADEAIAIGGAYWPWVGALHSLLDSVRDEVEDAAADHRSLLDNYASPQEAAGRLRLLAAEASRRASLLPDPCQHAVVLAGMIGSYLSCPAISERSQLVSQAVLETAGSLVSPTILMFRARRLSGHLVRALRVALSRPPVTSSNGSRRAKPI
jgi:tetraprenyl-beta-curcumene synthase